MSNWKRILAVSIVALLAFAPMMGTPTSADDYVTLYLKTFHNGEYQATLSFLQEGALRTNVELDPMAVVFNASVNATSGAYTPGGFDYPTDPYIDIGADGDIEWAYSGLGYGKWGIQNVFNDNSSMVNLTFNANETREVRFKIPNEAEIMGGAFTTGGWPVPYWGPEFTVSSTETESKGEFGPVIEVFDGKMYEAWESMDPTITDGDDADIVYRIFDGETWTEPMEITPPGDYFQDDSPNLIVYKDKLYCIWSASEGTDFFDDDDLIMRWTEDGVNWSPLTKVSPIIRNGMNDWPILAIYQEKLYIFWKTMDDNIADVTNDNDMDIVYRWWDGSNFGPIEEITKGDNGAIDWAYDATVYNNRLYIAWETDVDDWIGYQVDIVVKSFDGISWSNKKNLCPSGDDTKDEIPKLYVWFNPVKKIEELYLIWGRGNGDPEGNGDIDIVIRVFDGVSWSPRQEISKPNVQVQNMGHQLIGYEGRLYAIWIDGKESVVVGGNPSLIVFKIFGDIVIRSFDGYEWSAIKELTPSGQTDKASDPEICVFNGKLYASWSFPNDATPSSDDWDIILRHIDFQDVTLEVDIGNDGILDWSGELSSSQQIIPLNRSQIENAMVGGSIVDDYGNEITEVSIKIKSKHPAKIRVHDLKIEYDYTVHFDFTDDINEVLDLNRPITNDSRQDADPTKFPIEAGSGSEGKIILKDLEIEYMINYAPYLVREVPVIYMGEDTDYPDAEDLEEYFEDDWDDGRLRFRIVSMEDPALLEAYLNGSMIGFRTPTENWYGTSNVTVQAVDGLDLVSLAYVIRVEVTPVNDPPVLDFIPDQTVRIGERFRYQATAFDVDGDKLSYVDNSNKFNIEKDAGVISFIPSRRGDFAVNVTVQDGNGGEDQQEVSFKVIGEATSSTESGCYTLLAIIALAVAIALVAMKLRHEFRWGPIGPERLKLPKEGDGEAPADDGKKVAKGKRRRKPPGKVKRKAIIPGTDTRYDTYDANKDGFLDDREWSKAVKDLKNKKDDRSAKIRERAKRRAKMKLEAKEGAGVGEEGATVVPREHKKRRGRRPPPPPPDTSPASAFTPTEEYLPPGMRTRSMDGPKPEEGRYKWKKPPIIRRAKKK